MKQISCGKILVYKYGHEEFTTKCGELLKNPEEIVLCPDCKWRNKIENMRTRLCEGVTIEPTYEGPFKLIPKFHNYICPHMKNRFKPTDPKKTWNDFELKICKTCKIIDEVIGTTPPK